MSACERASIVGLGLVGGSLARDLSARGVRVSAYDADARHLALAERDGVIDRILDPSLAGIVDADVIIIAVPVDSAVDVLKCVAERDTRATLITDVGSTKVRIVDAASALGIGDRFVGSHPMAGDHRSGWSASRPGLFADARVYLCPTADSTPKTLDLATALWNGVGGRPTVMDAGDHDRKLAWTSHLPHVVSTALALAFARNGIRRDDLGPGGRDVTRLAGSSPEMWTAIARENAAAIEAAIAEAERELAAFREGLHRADPRELHDRFLTARSWFDE
ncbi:MAG TPA: prephenate dehydrogenase/arogenate dehydrogenase family protein [Gemmatimonadaceae bacterium]|nr:prephenate dehydrogenase/arogenate dehydrogenase family protein [Gemmatimonadaceae bacterium]